MGLFSNFFKRTVDSIIADIIAKVEQLQIVAQLHVEAEKIHNVEIAARTKLAIEARAEFARATNIADKLKALIS